MQMLKSQHAENNFFFLPFFSQKCCLKKTNCAAFGLVSGDFLLKAECFRAGASLTQPGCLF